MKKPIIHKIEPRVYKLHSRFYELTGEIFDYFHRTKTYVIDSSDNRVDIRTEREYYIFTFRDLRDTMVFEIGFGQFIKQEYDNYG